MGPYDLMRVAQTVEQMRSNSLAWHDSQTAEQKELAAKNQELARKLNTIMPEPVVYNPEDGTWRVGTTNGPKLYDLY